MRGELANHSTVEQMCVLRAEPPGRRAAGTPGRRAAVPQCRTAGRAHRLSPLSLAFDPNLCFS